MYKSKWNLRVLKAGLLNSVRCMVRVIAKKGCLDSDASREHIVHLTTITANDGESVSYYIKTTTNALPSPFQACPHSTS